MSDGPRALFSTGCASDGSSCVMRRSTTRLKPSYNRAQASAVDRQIVAAFPSRLSLYTLGDPAALNAE